VPFLLAVTAAQWSPLLTATIAMPWLGALLAAKPNFAIPYLATAPRRKQVAASFVVGALIVALSIVLAPDWPLRWIRIVARAPGFTSPIAHRGGLLVLLALTRWRRPEARLLLGMACVPHNMVLYEALPLFLIPRTFRESLWLALLSSLAAIFTMFFVSPYPRTITENYFQGDVIVALQYLPCLIMVLRRPNEGPVPAWLDATIRRARMRFVSPATPAD
jgi:hypothetical protein